MQQVNEIVDLFHRFGESDYLGESVSKLQHSLQCAELAERHGCSTEVILGAFLHDIGHLSGEATGKKHMIASDDNTNLGIYNHAIVGANFLEDRGFGPDVTDLVRYHVQAKRYLCYKQPGYFENLSWASKGTLKLQGGPMSAEQAAKFEENPRLASIVLVRKFDEQAKDPNWSSLKPLQYFQDMAVRYLNNRSQRSSEQ